jgi:tryptophan halogenase
MNLVIVGGGTAGWITALYAKKAYPNKTVILVESDEIGILGAGEGSTPSLISLFNFLEISTSDLINNCNATIKNSIKFSNWSKDNDYYFHPFASTNQASNDYNFSLNSYLELDTGFSHIYSSKFNHKIIDYCFMQKLSENFCVPIIENKEKYFEYETSKFYNIGFWSIHFDASMLAKYLRKVGEKRGIIRKEGKVEDIICDNSGNITELKTKNESIKTEFVFDCTGFKRMIIGNFYKSKWISHSKNLPIKRAAAFFLDIEKNIPPYTEAIAMKYGWMWKIPTQNRYGCGYAFDSDFISDDEAKKEIDDFLGFEVDPTRTFSFDAGFYEKVWINNCLAVGLSAGFIEPLEATSLMQLGFELEMFFSLYNNQELKENFNNYYKKQTEEVLNFIYVHYVTNKNNTTFWKDFTKNNEMPVFVENLLSFIKEYPPNELTFKNNEKVFNFTNYFYVLIGNKIINKKTLQKYLSLMKVDHSEEYLNILKNQEIAVPLAINHNYFLSKLKM